MSFFQKTINLRRLILFVGGTLAVAGISAFLGNTELDGLVKPPLTPPAWLFPVVWSILYLLMGYAAYRISVSHSSHKQQALTAYWIQLAVNALWTILFFRLEWRLFAFLWLLLLIVLIVRTIRQFCPIDKVSAVLLYPYLAWCAFASYLNLAFYLLNR